MADPTKGELRSALIFLSKLCTPCEQAVERLCGELDSAANELVCATRTQERQRGALLREMLFSLHRPNFKADGGRAACQCADQGVGPSNCTAHGGDGEAADA